MANPFDNSVIRDWFFVDDDWSGFFKNGVITTGSGPFEEENFDTFLKSKGIQVYELDMDIDTLIIGREDWDKREIVRYIKDKRGGDIYVYSQEMFLSLIKIGCPRNMKKIIEVFMIDHPVYEVLKEWEFSWPHTYNLFSSGRGELGYTTDWPSTGLLRYMDYGVGRNGKNPRVRQRILEEVFKKPIIPSQYKEEWGTANSSERLLKMANSIAAFARNARGRNDPPQEAIEDWEADLAWLKKEFYDGRFTFQWPSTLPF